MSFLPKFLQKQKDAAEIAYDVVMNIAEQSFHKFRESEFRSILNFENLDQEEQDRIFNELAITGMSLIYLTLERGEYENPNEKSKNTFRQIKNNIAGSYVRTLSGAGVEKQLTDLWYQLIAMRCQEYRGDFKSHKELFTDPRDNYWVHICSIGGSDHICRGRKEHIEKILPDMTRWSGKLYIESMRIIAKELDAKLSATGKSVNVSIKDDGSLNIK